MFFCNWNVCVCVCVSVHLCIYIYKRGTGWQAGENYDTAPHWESPPPIGNCPCRTPLVTAWPGLPQVGAQCGLSTVVSFKREAVCHPFRGAPVLWQNLSKTTFFGNLGWYAAATLRKGVRDGHGDYASWTQTPPLLRVNHHVWSAFCPPRGIALVRGRLAGLQPALGGEERRVGPSILPSSRLPTLPKPHKSATARPPPLAVAQGLAQQLGEGGA